ncbi:outer membrane receptor for ferrienterochelin and colicins [Lampropedia hyalina DSM 16112]|uniref:Outer membrane receptor for ferrienterochelin and colicins n=1 Tax=Lampropedia hyalina DSM 16112 TaxID=1122156 RepID=A0A1M5A0E5_9BURK|nr:TonB-dependent receptor [Lampropedia hyalina]SHF23780.1 outer membrane receptor for ferrienterochelin and colicins [Lampropedia hyalina DSM 16112]
MPSPTTPFAVAVTPVALSVALLCMASSATAQETPASNVLDEVVISAAGFEQKLTDAPASISVVTQEELAKRPYTSLIDAVRDLEGVDVGETSDKTGQRTISLRGMGADYTLVLVNGRRQSNHGDIYPNSFQGNQFNHIPPLDAIERIEVIRGPASTLYGADAMGGVINIITKKVGDQWAGSATVGRSFQQDSQFGDDTTLDFDLRGPIVADKLGLSIRGSIYDYEKSEPNYAPFTDPAGVVHERSLGFGSGGRTVDKTNKSLGFSLAFKPDSRQSLTLDWDMSRQKYDNSESQLGTLDGIASVWRASGGIVQPRVGYTRDQRFERDNWALTHEGEWDFGRSFVSLAYVETSNLGRSLPFRPGERHLLQEMYSGTGAYAGMSTAERRALAESTFLPRPKRTLESNQYTLDAKFDIPLRNLAGDHMLVVGGQMIDGELVDGVFGMEKDQDTGAQKQKMYALFVEDNWMPTEQFTLTAGLRYDHHDTFGSHVSPRVYGVYTLNPQWTVKGGVSTGYKTPNTTDLYDGITGFGGQGTNPWAGNPDLKPETSRNSELAVYWNHPNRHSFNATIFHNNFKDKIDNGEVTQTCAQTGGVRPCVNLGDYGDLGYTSYSQKVNVAKASIQGLELAGRYQLLPAIGLRGNYTYTDSEQKTGADAGQPLTNTSKHMANLTLDWQALPKLNTFLTAEYRSKRFRGSVDPATGEFLYYEGYNVLHLGASYKLNKNVTITGRVNNLLDRDFTSYRTSVVQNADGSYDVNFVDDYNNKDRARSFWISINARF